MLLANINHALRGFFLSCVVVVVDLLLVPYIVIVIAVFDMYLLFAYCVIALST